MSRKLKTNPIPSISINDTSLKEGKKPRHRSRRRQDKELVEKGTVSNIISRKDIDRSSIKQQDLDFVNGAAVFCSSKERETRIDSYHGHLHLKKNSLGLKQSNDSSKISMSRAIRDHHDKAKEKLNPGSGSAGVQAENTEMQDDELPELGTKKEQSETVKDSSKGEGGSDTDDDLSGLTFDSQEPILNSSQDDSLCEVRWDCRSPETIKQLKKLRGQYSAEGVKKIVANFSDDHVKPPEPSLRSLRIFMPPQPDDTFVSKSKAQKAKERAAKKHQQRLKSRENVQGMIILLQELAAKQRKASEEQSPVSTDDTADDKATKSCDTLTGSNEAKVNTECDNDDDCWSDDDLFKDNSFLIEATQNPEKFLNTSRDLGSTQRSCGNVTSEKSKSHATDKSLPHSVSSSTSHTGANSTYTNQSIFNDTSVVPSSYVPKGTVVPGKNPSVRPAPSNLSNHKSSTGATNSKNFNKPHIVQKTLPYTTANSKGVKTSATNGSNNYITYGNNAGCFKSSSTAYSSSSARGNIYTSNSGAAFNSKCTASVKNFVNQNMSQNRHSIIVNVPPGAKIKTSFRKFNSFQADGSSLQKSSSTIPAKDSPNSSLNTSFRKTLSFDVSNSPSTNQCNLPHKSVSPSVPHFQNQTKPNSYNPHSYSSKPSNPGGVAVKPAVYGQFSTSVNMQNQKSATSSYSSSKLFNNKSNISRTGTFNGKEQPNLSHHSNNNNKASNKPNLDDGFDISLPEDVLQQLLEPDDLFDSQADIAPIVTKAAVQPASSNVCSTDINANQRCTGVVISREQTTENKGLTNLTGTGANLPLKSSTAVKSGALKPNNRQSDGTKRKEPLLSPVKPVMCVPGVHAAGFGSPMQSFFKKTFGVQQTQPQHLKVLKHGQSFGPSSSTPIKQAKREDCEKAKDNGCSDSFLEGAFDDSFLNDNAMYESQILPLLEKMESEATASAKPKIAGPTLPSSPVKCSPEQIEQKRQAALQRRSMRLSQLSQRKS